MSLRPCHTASGTSCALGHHHPAAPPAPTLNPTPLLPTNPLPGILWHRTAGLEAASR